MATQSKGLSSVLRVLFILLTSLTAILILAVAANAYPDGWTSDNPVAAGYQLDIYSRGNNVYLVYVKADGRVYIRTSSNKGVTWSPETLTSGVDAECSYPQVTVKSDGAVLVAYKGSVPSRNIGAVVVRTSADSYATQYSCRDDDYSVAVAMTHGTDNPAVCWQTRKAPASGAYDIYYSPVAPGTLQRNLAVETNDEHSYTSPRIATDGTDMIVVYDLSDSNNHEHSGIWYTTVVGGVVTPHNMDIRDGHSFSNPDISYQGSGYYTATYTDFRTSARWVLSNGYNGSSWGGAVDMYNALEQEPKPRTIPYDSGWLVSRASNGEDAQLVIDASESKALFESVSPRNSANGVATACENVGTDVYVAVVGGDNTIKVKRTDGVAPTSTGIQVTGAYPHAEGPETVYYAGTNFQVNFQNAADDWNLTGTDPLSDSFTAGVSKIDVKYSTNGNPPWNPLPMTGAGAMDNFPWKTTVDVGSLTEGNKYIRGVLSDTARKPGNSPIIHAVIDKTPPTVEILDSYTDGWSPANVAVTLTGADNYGLESIEYKLYPNNGSPEGAWKTYSPSTGITVTTGEWVVTARSKDKAGNYSAVALMTYSVDSSTPSVSITDPVNGGTFTTNKDNWFYFKARATDTGLMKSCVVKLDGKTIYSFADTDPRLYNMCVSYKFPANAPEKAYTFSVEVLDTGGHLGKATSTARLVKGTTVMGNWYFAEGSTQPGFDEYLSVYNPMGVQATVSFGFLPSAGATKSSGPHRVSPKSRCTYNVRDLVGNGDYAVHVTATTGVVIERPMYFTYKGWTGGTCVLGVNNPRKVWYFAEGTTRDANNGGPFDTYLCLANFESASATVTVTYMLENGTCPTKAYTVAARSRKTVNVNAEIGTNRDVSFKISSSRNIVAERAMYFNHNGITGGSAIVGTDGPGTKWYFAEGNTQPGFEEFITIQNPNAGSARISLQPRIGNMSPPYNEKDPVAKVVNIPGNTRKTFRLTDFAPSGKDVSVEVTSNLSVVAERPIYFTYKGWDGGHDGMGAKTMKEDYFLAEGTTRYNANDGYYDEWLTAYSPTDGNALTITYTFPDGTDTSEWYALGSSRRLSVNVNKEMSKFGKPGQDVSVRVQGDNPFTVERPMYFNRRGITGGSTVSGYAPPGQ